MHEKLQSQRWITQILLVCFLFVNTHQMAIAGLVSTEEILDDEIVLAEKQRFLDLLARDDVQAKLVSMGVDPKDAEQRLHNLTPEEIRLMSAKMEELPSGSGAVGAIVFVFLVLLITDLLGLTDVFPFVKKQR